MTPENVLKTASDWYNAYLAAVAEKYALDLLNAEYDTVLDSTEIPDYDKIRRLHLLIQDKREALDKSRKELERAKTNHWTAIQDWRDG